MQLVLPGGIGGVFIVSYAIRGITEKRDAPQSSGTPFTSEYQELMWLAEEEKRHLNADEKQRFYQLRRQWSDMHSAMGTLTA